MTVLELIVELSKFDPHMKVKMFNSDNITHVDPVCSVVESWTEPATYIDHRETIVEINYD